MKFTPEELKVLSGAMVFLHASLVARTKHTARNEDVERYKKEVSTLSSKIQSKLIKC